MNNENLISVLKKTYPNFDVMVKTLHKYKNTIISIKQYDKWLNVIEQNSLENDEIILTPEEVKEKIRVSLGNFLGFEIQFREEQTFINRQEYFENSTDVANVLIIEKKRNYKEA